MLWEKKGVSRINKDVKLQFVLNMRPSCVKLTQSIKDMHWLLPMMEALNKNLCLNSLSSTLPTITCCPPFLHSLFLELQRESCHHFHLIS